MNFIQIVKDYINHNKSIFYTYVFLCCLMYIIKVIVMSNVYSRLFNKNSDIETTIKYICITWITICVLYVIKLRIETQVTLSFLSKIKHDIFSFYIKNNEYNFDDNNVNTDVARILEVTRSIRGLFFWTVNSLIPIIILIITINIYFMVKYPQVGIINIIGNITLFYYVISISDQLIKTSNIRELQYLKLNDKIDDNFNNMMNIFLNDKTDETIRITDELDQEYNELYKLQSGELERFVSVLKLIIYTFSGASLITLYKYAKMDQFINILMIFTFYIGLFENISEDIPYQITLIGSIKHTEKILSKNKKEERTYSKSLSSFKGNIEFKNITFTYPTTESHKESKKVIENFTLSVKAGERVTIMSQSGSGKSTLIKILLGFYHPQEGVITLDDQDSKDFDPKEIRKKINYVNQRTLLMQDTILNNMKYGNTKTDQEITKMLIDYDLLPVFINPKEFDPKNPLECLQKVVLKNGINISMGMQKVIFIVRGLLKEGVDVYVLDEPLTSIDSGTRKKVLDLINTLTRGKTLIIISHDDEVSQIQDMKILYLDKNKEETKE
jgi:ABC-type multidrug transport system fused ATPase/permease subunit